MQLKTSIAPTDLRDYAQAKGWVLVKETAKDRRILMPLRSRSLRFANASPLSCNQHCAVP